MNTKLLQHHLVSSLTDLARVCESNEKSEDTDELVIRVLADERMDEEELLQSIQEVNKEVHRITMVEGGYDAEINFNQLYNTSDYESECRSRIWGGLRKIAVSMAEKPGHKNETIVKFIYRALLSMDRPEDSGISKEMDIVEKICSAS